MNWKFVLSSLGIAVVLPVMLIGVLSNDGRRWISKADSTENLRIWLEPKEIISKPNNRLKIVVMAAYSEKNKFLSRINTKIKPISGLLSEEINIESKEPLTGVKKIGEIELNTQNPGTYKLEFDETAFSDQKNLIIEYSGTNITVVP